MIVDLVHRWVSWFLTLSLHIEEIKILVLIFSFIASNYHIINLSILSAIILCSYHIIAIGEFVYPMCLRIRPLLPILCVSEKCVYDACIVCLCMFVYSVC